MLSHPVFNIQFYVPIHAYVFPIVSYPSGFPIQHNYGHTTACGCLVNCCSRQHLLWYSGNSTLWCLTSPIPITHCEAHNA
jgi:hypothetical protein